MLRLLDLTKKYPGGKGIFHVTLEARAGEVTGLAGPNGCGKTTTLLCAAGLLKADAGIVELDGKALPPHAGGRGFLAEERMRVEGCSVEEFLRAAGCLRGMRKEEIRRRIREFASGSGERISLRARMESLSKGNRQRVYLAASAIHAPDVLLLDEPLSGLDEEGKREIGEWIRSYAQTHIVLCSLHEPEWMAKLAGRRIRMKEGEVDAA